MAPPPPPPDGGGADRGERRDDALADPFADIDQQLARVRARLDARLAGLRRAATDEARGPHEAVERARSALGVLHEAIQRDVLARLKLSTAEIAAEFGLGAAPDPGTRAVADTERAARVAEARVALEMVEETVRELRALPLLQPATVAAPERATLVHAPPPPAAPAPVAQPVAAATVPDVATTPPEPRAPAAPVVVRTLREAAEQLARMPPREAYGVGDAAPGAPPAAPAAPGSKIPRAVRAMAARLADEEPAGPAAELPPHLRRRDAAPDPGADPPDAAARAALRHLRPAEIPHLRAAAQRRDGRGRVAAELTLIGGRTMPDKVAWLEHWLGVPVRWVQTASNGGHHVLSNARNMIAGGGVTALVICEGLVGAQVARDLRNAAKSHRVPWANAGTAGCEQLARALRELEQKLADPTITG